MKAPAVEQLVDLASGRLSALGPLVGIDTVIDIEESCVVQARASGIVAELTQPDDDRLAAEAGRTVMGLICGEPDPEWWRTPLGALCARALGTVESDAITHSHAAAMLKVTRGTISQMVARGTLDRHPDGGVLRASVLQRLARKQ